MENGFDGGLLADKLSGLGLSHDHDHDHNHNHSLSQVLEAVETAEATIKHQIDENIRLRTELQDKILELEKYKAYGSMALKNTVSGRDEHFYRDYGAHQPALSVGDPEDSFRRMGDTTLRDQASTIIVHDIKPNNDSGDRLSHKGIHSESSKLNGTLEVIGGPQAPVENSGFSQLSSPSASSLSLNRYQTEREYDRQLNYHGDGLMQIAEVDGSVSLHKQDLVQKVREQEQEIVQLKRHLADYSIKEAQIRNEKYVLDKRIAYMRLAFDQQQQDLVDDASKSLSYRQDIMEENIRLSYQLQVRGMKTISLQLVAAVRLRTHTLILSLSSLVGKALRNGDADDAYGCFQAAQQERLTFVSSLLPLLAEYSLQPPVLDAQSIVSNVKVLFKHLQEKLNITESKLKEPQFQLGAWSSDFNPSTFAPQSPAHLNKNELELVPQQMISHGNVAIFSSDTPATAGWDLLNHRQAAPSAIESKIMDRDDLGLHSPPASRNNVAHDMPVTPMQGRGAVTPMQDRGAVTPMQGRGQVTPMQGRGTVTHHNEENTKQVTFREPVSNSRLDYPDTEGSHGDRPPPANRASGNSTYAAGPDDPNSSYSPYLAPVMEEPSSSFSDAADDDPSPAIEGLQISGDAFPGRELLASGYSINGTTSCNFEWVRHLEDGSVNYIDGAKQPNYLVTADDIDTYLAIEVQPLDDRKRKGELVKVFANEHRKIACDSEMQHYIERTLYSGHASFKISLSMGFLHIWEPSILAIKREGYSIKCSGPSGVVVTEKFSPTTSVTIPYGYASSFSIKSSNGEEHLLSVENGSEDIGCARDTIVLTLRLFIMRASGKMKGKKRGLFFNK